MAEATWLLIVLFCSGPDNERVCQPKVHMTFASADACERVRSALYKYDRATCIASNHVVAKQWPAP